MLRSFFRYLAGCGAIVFAHIGGAQSLEIWEIQGDGLTSPFEGERVTTTDNVVTAVGGSLFFIQTPDARSDGDAWTSDGMVVALGSSPPVAVGDMVDVTGTVREEFGQTEIAGGPTVTVTSTGHPRPRAVLLDGETPTPLQPWPETELERFEGMWVEVRSGVVSAPSDDHGEACVTTGPRRLFREPGIIWPGLAGLAVWDGNPEGFELDPYGLGGAGFDLVAGTRFRASGVLAYAFGAYQLWPVTFTGFDDSALPRAVPLASPGDVAIGTQNLFHFGGPGADVPYATRLTKLSRHVREVLRSPHLLAVQEAFDLAVLQDLADRVADDDPSIRYEAYLVKNDPDSIINVGYLIRDPVVARSIAQIGTDVRFTWDGSLLFDRPPLVLEAAIPRAGESIELTVIAVHLRSLGGIEDPEIGERVRRKRHEQSVWLSEWIQAWQNADPTGHLVVLGDLNAFEFSDGYVDVVGQVTGDLDPDGALLAASEEVEPQLVNWVLRLPADDRYSFVFECSAEVLDHILTNHAATPWVRGIAAARANADAPHDLEFDATTSMRSSDHDGLVLYLGPRLRRDVVRRVAPVSAAQTIWR
jgi:endonuclease/exonuclease/phosphatase family metal-dependent hydrolase